MPRDSLSFVMLVLAALALVSVAVLLALHPIWPMQGYHQR